MKKRSWSFFILAAIFLAAGLLSGQRVFYVLLFCQAALLLAGTLINLWAALSFTYTQELGSNATMRGRPVQLSLSIHNEKPLPFPLLRCRINLSSGTSQELSFNLAAHDQASFSLTVPCQHRGLYQVGMTVIDFVDLFGIWRMPFDMRLLPYYRMKELLVYPRLVRLGHLRLPQLDSQKSSRRPDLGDDSTYPYAMTRKYRPGDRARQIHWQVSLRQRTLMTRIYDHVAEPGIELILDLDDAGYSGIPARQAQDIFCETATALIFHLLGQNRPVQLKAHGSGSRVFQLTSLADFSPVYKWLAEVNFSSQASLAAWLPKSSPAGGRIILTCRHDPGLAGLLAGDSRQMKDQVIVACPAQATGRAEGADLLYQQQKLPILAVYYGDDLARKLQGDGS
jgi:uncharacterized protein (DUF58 family)